MDNRGNDGRTAALCIIGNEVLSGRTRDANGHYIAVRLAALGIALRRILVIPDEMETIVEAVRHWKSRCDYLFTTGGIGPTHDDITREAVARALGRPLAMHPEAQAVVRQYYGERINEVRLEMARLPQGAELIRNPRTGVPGCIVENVYVLPGIPSLIEEMFPTIEPRLGSAPVFRGELPTLLYEGEYAEWLAQLAESRPQIEIGSYPILGDPACRTVLSVASRDMEAGRDALETIRERVREMERRLGRRVGQA